MPGTETRFPGALRKDLRAALIVERILSISALFALRFFNFFFRASGSWLQAWTASLTSSSYFLHVPKALLQDFTADVWLSLSSLRLQALSSAITFEVASSASQQSQAELALFCDVQFFVKFLKCSMAATQALSSVALGAGWLDSWQAS